jgi:hypothetical protein
MNGLPEELAVAFAETHDDAVIAFHGRIAGRLIVGADENLPAGDDRTSVRDLSQFGHPFDVLSLSLFGTPFRGHVLVPGVDGITAQRASTHGAIVIRLFPGVVRSDLSSTEHNPESERADHNGELANKPANLHGA